VHKKPADRAHNQQRKKETEHQMQELDDPVDHGDGKPEGRLSRWFEGSRGGVGNHIKGEYDESRAGHRHQCNENRRAKQPSANDSLQNEASNPSGHQRQSAGK